MIYEIDAETGLSTGEGCRARARLSHSADCRAPRLGGAGASGRSAAAGAMVRPRRRVDGRRSSTASVTATATTSRCSTRPAWCGMPPARWCASSVWRIDISEQAQRAGSTARSRRNCCRWWPPAPATGSSWSTRERRVQFINRGMRAQSRESIIGQRVDELAVAEDRDELLRRAQQVLDTGEPVDLQLASSGTQYGGRYFDSRIRAVRSPARHHAARSSTSPRSPTATPRSTCAKPRRACSSCCTKAWSSSTRTT